MAEKMEQFTVIAGAVNVTTGRKRNGRPEVTRLVRGTTLEAPVGDERTEYLLGLNAIVPKGDKEALKSLREKGTVRQPTVVKDGRGFVRLTARGAAVAFNTVADPVILPGDEDVPLLAPSSGIVVQPQA